MMSRLTICFIVIVIGFMCQQSKSQSCEDIDESVEIDTDLKTSGGEPMTYVGTGKKLIIRCTFTCKKCVKRNIIWTKDNKNVLIKDLRDGSVIANDDFENRVKLSEVNPDETYELTWKDPTWEDVTSSSRSAHWGCRIQSNTCPGKNASLAVKYYRYPLLTYYIDEEEVTDDDHLTNVRGKVLACVVLAYPVPKIAISQYDKTKLEDASCESYEYESICNISVNYKCPECENYIVDNGCYECRVEYDDPESESEKPEAVVPDTCDSCKTRFCAEDPGLSAGIIATIVLAVLILVGLVVIFGLHCFVFGLRQK